MQSDQYLEFHAAIVELQATPLPQSIRWLNGTIFLLLLGLIGWSALAKIDIVASAQGKVQPEGRLRVVQSADAAIVRAILVREGDYVKAAQTVVELDPTANSADGQANQDRLAVALLDITRLRSELNGQTPSYRMLGASAQQIQLAESLRAARIAEYEAKLAEAAGQQRTQAVSLAAAKDNLHRLELTTQTVREKERRVRPYVGSVLAQFDYLKLKDELTQAEADLATQAKAVHQAELQEEAAAQRVRQIVQSRKSQVNAELNEAIDRRTVLTSDKNKNDQLLHQKHIASPVNGYVQSVALNSEGGFVTPGQTLMTVVPSGVQLVVEAYLSNEDIGFVQAGQQADLKFDAFPFQQYGTIRGQVIDVSPDSEQRTAGATPSDAVTPTKAGLLYRIKIRADQAYMQVGPRRVPLKTGMTVIADVKTGRRSLLSFFTAPLTRYLDEGLSPR